MIRSKRGIMSACAAGTLALAPLGAVAAPDGEPGPRYGVGDDGAGDPYLPQAGNGGIDIEHHSLDLAYTPPEPEPAPLEGYLDGTATIALTATQDLRSFNLDLRGPEATSVTVNGKKVKFSHDGGNELTIEPRPKLKTGQEATVVVEYEGPTGRPVDLEGALYGWVTTRDGAIVTSQPDGAATWFPTSDHPTDKASYDFSISVPDPLVAVANGVLTGSESEDGWTTWEWDAPDPMAAYLATATVSNFELSFSEGPGGIPIIDAVDADLPASASANLALTPEMMGFYEDIFGPYPFVAYGQIVDDDSVGYALETQTRSFFSRTAREGTVAHELIHQWIGDDLSVATWADIWHNEGWATYGTWLWTDHQSGRTVEESFESVMAIPADNAFWDLVIADPGPLHLFHSAIYSRSGAMLYALREKIGDDDFLALTRRWVQENSGSHASTADYTTMAEEVSGQDLGHFFEVWLYTAGKPSDW